MSTDPAEVPADTRWNSSRTDEPNDKAPSSEAPAPESDTSTGSQDPPSGEADPLTVPRERRKIQVGSRTTRSGKSVKVGRGAATPPADAASATESSDAVEALLSQQPVVPTKVPRPSRRDSLTPEMEQEFEAALGGASMEELLGSNPLTEEASQVLEVDSRHPATVVKVHGENIFFSLGGRNEAVASVRQFDEPPSLGDSMEVIILRYHAEDGLYEVSVPGASVEVHDWSDLVEGAVVEARITGSNVGGLECLVNQIRGFIPASQISLHHVDNMAEYYEQKLLCVVTEANERQRNLVLSHRAVLEREKQAQRERLLEELEVGQVREGVVTNMRPFGAFVDLGGIDGLVHISQLSWDRVNHPNEVLEEGQKVRVKIEKIDPQTGKIGLSYRDLLEHPWDHVEDQFSVEMTVKGTVTRIAQFGAFVKLAPGVEGLVHISELAHHRVVQVNSVVQEGQEIDVKIMSIDRENQRIGLSLKAAHPLPDPEEAESGEMAVEEAARQPLVKPRKEPLRGGREGSTGGEHFGLRW